MAGAVQCMSCARFVPLQSQRKPLLRSLFLSYPSRNFNLSSSFVAASSRNKNKKSLAPSDVSEEDAFEMLFKQLEEDLKNDDLSKGDDLSEEITEEDIAAFERELGDALGDYDAELLNSDSSDAENGNDDGNDDDDGGDDGVESSPKLRNWQMKKLARALKIGRRKTSIKNLAAELCLDRALVLELLRNPPPNLLMMSLSVPDEPTATITSLETKPKDIIHKEISTDQVGSEPKAQVPIHTMQRSWTAQKRLKKADIDTLERVYQRSKRPTEAMQNAMVNFP